MENIFITTNTLVYMLVFGVISVISGVITKKTWRIIKKSKLIFRISAKKENSIPGNTLSIIVLILGSIMLTIVFITVMITLFAIINIGMTWAVSLYYVTGNYLPMGIYFCTTLLGLSLEDYFGSLYNETIITSQHFVAGVFL